MSVLWRDGSRGLRLSELSVFSFSLSFVCFFSLSVMLCGARACSGPLEALPCVVSCHVPCPLHAWTFEMWRCICDFMVPPHLHFHRLGKEALRIGRDRHDRGQLLLFGSGLWGFLSRWEGSSSASRVLMWHLEASVMFWDGWD
jgi:hypothetical protein